MESVANVPTSTVLLPAVAGLMVVYYFWSYFFTLQPTLNAPFASLNGKIPKRIKSKDRTGTNLRSILKENYARYRDHFFKIKEPWGDVLVTPLKYIEELKALPEDIISFSEETDERLLGNYTLLSQKSVGGHGGAFNKSVTNQLTRSLSALMEDIHDECDFAFKEYIGPCDDWTEVNIFSKLISIVALVSGRVFIGAELCRDLDYLRTIIQFTLRVFVASVKLMEYHPLLRPIAARFLPDVRAVHDSHAEMIRLITPAIAARAAAIEDGSPTRDLATWNMLNSTHNENESVRIQAHYQLIGSMAAIHTTSLTGSHILYDLAARPEYLEPLRKELAEVQKEEKVPWLTKTSAPKLKLLDSFCRESQRLNPLGLTSFSRKVKKPITLHDGIVIPPGSRLSVPLAEINLDPEIYPEPERFDGFRFAKLRQEPGMENRHQFVTTSLNHMSFGHGTHACPGRFFANNEIKVILTYLFQHYDIKMPEGQGRPENLYIAEGIRPDTSKSLLMRRRSVAREE